MKKEEAMEEENTLRRMLGDVQGRIRVLEGFIGVIADGDAMPDAKNRFGELVGIERLWRVLDWGTHDPMAPARVVNDCDREEIEKMLTHAASEIELLRAIQKRAEQLMEEPFAEEFVTVARVRGDRMLCLECWRKIANAYGRADVEVDDVHISAGPNPVLCAECRRGMFVE